MSTRTARRALVALATIAAATLSNCTRDADVTTIGFYDPRFNERIRANFQPLMGDERTRDTTLGFFSDGSDGGLISELFPVAASATAVGGAASLVKSGCLFVGNQMGVDRRVGGDEIRIAWEVAAKVIQFGDADLRASFAPGHEELGLCTMSSPVERLLFEKPGQPQHGSLDSAICIGDRPGTGVRLSFDEDPSSYANIPINCVVGHEWKSVTLEGFSPAKPDPDGECPGRFDVSTYVASELPACGMPPGQAVPAPVPDRDTSYRLQVLGTGSFKNNYVEKWVSPTVMPVNEKRTLTRRLWPVPVPSPSPTPWPSPTASPSPSPSPTPAPEFTWSTHVRQDDDDGPTRWDENYTPSVLVNQVEIVARDAGDRETNVRPDDGRLRIVIPRAGGAPDAPVTCTGTVKNGAFSFAIPGECAFDDPQLGALTPTYATASVYGVRPAKLPVRWYARLGQLGMSRPFIRFSVAVQPRGAALRISPALRFGRMQVGESKPAEVVLENIGGPDLEVRSLGFAATSRNPGDFSFVTAGDPVDVPLPIEGTPDGQGGLSFGLGADIADAPILNFKDQGTSVDVWLGDETGGGPLTLYGHTAHIANGVLFRDDPSATFVPGTAAVRPFALPAFSEKRTPFLLRSGQSVKVVVTAKPSATGTRRADLRAEAVPIGNPTTTLRATSQLSIDALSGPDLETAPALLYFNRQSSDEPRDLIRMALALNRGNFDLSVTRIAITGRDAGRFHVSSRPHGPVPFTLVPGDYQDIEVTYTPQCDGTYTIPDHIANLVVESTGGNRQIPLSGASFGFCELP